MKTKLLAPMLVAGSPAFAQVAVSIGIGPVLYPAPVAVVAPMPAPVVAVVPPAPAVGFTWVAGYWHPAGTGWAWHAGYWGAPPYANAHWVAPHCVGGQYYPGYWHPAATTTVASGPGSYSRDTTITGYNGRTATYQNNATWGNGSYSDTRTVTGPNGRTATSTTTATYAPGSTTRDTTVHNLQINAAESELQVRPAGYLTSTLQMSFSGHGDSLSIPAVLSRAPAKYVP